MTPNLSADLSAFGDLRLRHPLRGGHRNAVWLVDTPRGTAVAKSCTHSAAALAWLAPVQAAARAAGFIVPAFHRTRDGAILSNGWTVEDWIPGQPFTLADMPGLAKSLQDFHSHIPTLPQRPGLQSLPDLIHARPNLPPHIAALCHAALQPFANQQTHAIHGDITPANLIHSPDGPALIDWDEARCDLAFLDFMHVSPRNPAEIRAHLAGEVISGWHAEPLYAQACATRLAHL